MINDLLPRYLMEERFQLERAAEHEALGHPQEWADRSRAKAAKWRQKHETWLKLETEFRLNDPFAAAVVDDVMSQIDANILLGDPSQNHNGLI